MSKSMEQRARNMMARAGDKDAHSRTSGDVVEIANLISDFKRLTDELSDLGITVDFRPKGHDPTPFQIQEEGAEGPTFLGFSTLRKAIAHIYAAPTRTPE